MPPRTPSRKRLRSLCAEVSPDDGADPRVFFRKDGSRGKPRHKAQQLCRQVAEALEASFETSNSDDLLGDLTVAGVAPAPDSTCLLVTITLKVASPSSSPAQILQRIDQAAGWLRAEVAAAIIRKRAPLLVYRVLEIRDEPINI